MSEQPELFPTPPPVHTNTPDRPLTSGGTRITVKRACNGCGLELGEATDAEIEACVVGAPMPDVRAQCPTCTPS
jgi:hypothetical protein